LLDLWKIRPLKLAKKTAGVGGEIFHIIADRPGWRGTEKRANRKSGRARVVTQTRGVKGRYFLDVGYTEGSRMSAFEKALIGFVCAGAAGLAVAAAVFPIDTATKSPRAVFQAPGGGDEQAVTSGGGQVTAKAGGPTVAAVSGSFIRHKYDMETIRAGKSQVPPLFLTAFPRDILRISQPETRKKFFFKMVLPLVLRVNDRIAGDRRRLLPLKAALRSGRRLAAADRLWLAAKSDQYGVRRGDMAELARRMDTVPPSLAIAQAAEETGWGTSRFAREGNALFGQWTFAAVGGLVPKSRDNGKSHKVKAFQTLTEAVGAYVANLNTHRAYRGFRAERMRVRRHGELSGLELARTLGSYSERGRAYVSSIIRIIRANRLGQLDKARLSASGMAAAKEPAI
jgi:Bax protein|tara:strand:- start:1229 stop:2422 length:1194 start_codon:yes stop_codon:yes gene_type:complete